MLCHSGSKENFPQELGRLQPTAEVYHRSLTQADSNGTNTFARFDSDDVGSASAFYAFAVLLGKICLNSLRSRSLFPLRISSALAGSGRD